MTEPWIDITQQRLAALQSVIQKHKEWIQVTFNPSTNRSEFLICLLDRLSAFATHHIDYFLVEFKVRGNRSPKFPPEHVLNVVLKQIADDISLIRQAALDENLANHFSDIRETLNKADHLVIDALKPATQWIPDKKQKALTYFQKRAATRVIPYDQDALALVAVPFTSFPFNVRDDNDEVIEVQLYREFLAIPHEVGHYVYWNARLDAVGNERQGGQKKIALRYKLRQLLAGEPNWVKKWTEEIFADMYGCLVAGTVIALDFQDLQLLESKNRFMGDDGEHPAPVVRPFIYQDTLIWKEEPPELVNPLSFRWNDKLKERLDPEGSKPRLYLTKEKIDLARFPMSGVPAAEMLYEEAVASDAFKVTVAEAIDTLGRVVDIIYTELLGQLDFTQSDLWAGITYPATVPNDLEQWYKIFSDAVKGWEPGNPVVYEEDCLIEDYNNWKGKLLDVEDTIGIENAPPDWAKVWIADGWATRGPQNPWT